LTLRTAAALGFLLVLPAPAEPLDRIAVSVANQVITESALLLDLRVTAFMSQTPLDFSPAAKRREANRLVDLALMRKEADDGHLVLEGSEAPKLLASLKARYRGDPEYQAELQRYGISEKDLMDHLTAGARMLAFSDLRFRPATQISEEELRAYYDKLVAGASAPNPSFEAKRAEIEELLRGQKAMDALDEWLKGQRKTVRIDFREKVFE